jgi:hypothetical protein
LAAVAAACDDPAVVGNGAPASEAQTSALKPTRLPCCPVGWDMFACVEPDGGKGLNCHNPLLECVSSLTCGGGCDFEVRGRCRCVQTVLCVQGSHFDSSPAVCACVPDKQPDCGTVTCPDGQSCCNASCGICTPPGVACIQIACVSPL